MFQAATETKARIGAKFGQSLVITLKNVPHASLPQGLIPVSRLDHNQRKSVPSARSKDKTRFTSINPVKCQTDCQPTKHSKMQVLRNELPLLSR